MTRFEAGSFNVTAGPCGRRYDPEERETLLAWLRYLSFGGVHSDRLKRLKTKNSTHHTIDPMNVELSRCQLGISCHLSGAPSALCMHGPFATANQPIKRGITRLKVGF